MIAVMRKQQFSLIELMLALGVVIIGVCSVMVLFPIGANASRDASMETFAAQAADQLLNFTKYQLSLPETASNNWRTRIGLDGSSSLLPNSKPSESDGGLDCLSTAWSRSTNMSALGLNLFYYSTEADGLFQLVSYRGNPANNFSINDTDIDYRVIMRLWTSRIDLNGDGVENNDDFRFGTRLNVEASWPAEIPYAQRQTALYTLDVFRPPKTANYAN
jgi:type II secretory pathway pseudopilin PulG